MGLEELAWHGLGGLLFLFGLQVVRTGYRNRRRATEIDETETTPIRNLDAGDAPVQVTGTARPTDAGTVEARVAETEGMVVETVVQEWDRTDDPNDPDGAGGHWSRRRSHVSAEPFVLEDDTGRAVVEVEDGDDLRLELERTKIGVGRHEDLPEPVRDHLDAVPYDRPTGRKLRYLQGAVEPGEEVYCYATAVEDRAGWDGPDAVLSADPAGGETIVSDRSEEAVVDRTGSRGLKQYFVGGVLLLMGAGIAVVPLT